MERGWIRNEQIKRFQNEIEFSSSEMLILQGSKPPMTNQSELGNLYKANRCGEMLIRLVQSIYLIKIGTSDTVSIILAYDELNFGTLTHFWLSYGSASNA